MKCPYRTITETTDGISKTEFCDCYGLACPWYCNTTTKGDKAISEESCQRCYTEHLRARYFDANRKFLSSK